MRSATLDKQLFQQAVSSMPEDALSPLRAAAAGDFARTGFPSLHDEDWRYTDLTPAVNLSNSWMADTAPSPIDVSGTPDIVDSVDAHWIHIRNGIADIESLPAGVSARNLSGNYGAATVDIDHPLTQFNAALLGDALEITFSADTEIDKPIGLLINDTAADSAFVTQTRVVLQVHSGASAKVVEAHVSEGDADHYNNCVVQVTLAPNATLDYVRMQQRARHHMQTGRFTAVLGDDACLRHCAFDLGGSLIRNDLAISLQGHNSSASLEGLYLAGNHQHIDNHTRVDHIVGPSRSQEQYRGILNRKSRCVFNGKAIVHRGADGSDAQQANHNLLLSGDAEIDTKPELEIYADDVKCSHGATVGQLDDDALFYLQTRGLNRDAAIQLMTRAFASELLGTISVSETRDFISAAVDARLNTLIGDQSDE